MEMVREGSPCWEAVKEGDLLLEIAGRRPLDVLDVMEMGAEGRVKLRLRREGRELTRVIRKPPGQPLYLVFDEAVFDGTRRCANRCVFCFVDQMPPGLRETLYVKDDDYRLSFLHGNFITLNNLSREDVERIMGMRLSPLYVSLHSTSPETRSKLMGGQAEKGLEVLRELLEAGLEIHLQVVVCPGLNDGEELRRTFQEVLEKYKGTASLAAVPVGLTRFAENLPEKVSPHDPDSAACVVELVEEFQSLALESYGSRIFHAADELYLLAGSPFPSEEDYEGYPQLENGVGLARKLMEEMGRAVVELGPTVPARGIVTGRLGEIVLRQGLSEAGCTGAETIAVVNRLLGETVTVSGLLAGRDIAEALRETRPASRELLVPESALPEGRFIDDLTPREVEEATGYRLVPCPVEGGELLRLLGGGDPRA
ncbi:MAG: DUF512 domain-containing protein [Actinobacteria bacterium]|nr:DUF512 domain-containing protein [Actinomycetota bacterium]